MGGGGVVMNSNRAQWEAWWLGLQLEESRPWECSHIKACSFQHLELDAGFQLGPSSPLFLSLPIWFDFPHSTEAGFQGKCPERARQKLYFFFLIWLHWVLVVACRIFLAVCGIFLAACRIFSYSMRDQVPWPGIEPQPPCMEMRNLNHQTMKEVPEAASASEATYHHLHHSPLTRAVASPV